MSLARAAAQIVGFLVVLVAVIAAYNFAAYAVVQNALSQAKNAPPFPTTELKTNFDLKEFKGLGDDFLYKPERGRFGDR